MLVKRCKKNAGNETHNRVHGVGPKCNYTLCGMDVDSWLSYMGGDADESMITCPKCKKELRQSRDREVKFPIRPTEALYDLGKKETK